MNSNPISVLITMAIGAVLTFVAVFFGGAFLSWDSTDVDEVGLHYSGGPIEGRAFEALVPPSTSGTLYGPMDTLVKLPANQRTYIVSAGDDGDRGGADAIRAKNKEGVEVGYETTMYFSLNQDPRWLKLFYEKVCTKYDECEDDPGSGDDGWGRMLNDNIRKVQETSIQNASRRATTDDLVVDSDRLIAIQDDVASELTRTVNDNLGGPIFENIKFQINNTQIPKEVADGYNRTKAAQLLTATRVEEVEQAEAQADAAAKLREASESEGYVELKRIEMLQKLGESGDINTVVVPSGQDMTLPAPK